MKQQPEFQLQCAVAEYLRLRYPNTFFLSDTVAAIHLTEPQKARNSRVQCAWFRCPDLIILESRNGWHALLIELKAKPIHKKDGVTLLKNEHVTRQAATIKRLNELGYKAAFACSFDEARRLIDEYFKF